MNKTITTALVILVFVVLAAAPVFAGTDEDIEVLKRMLERQQAEIDELKAELDAQKTEELSVADKLEAFIESDGEPIDAEPGKGIWSLKNEWFQLNGLCEFEFHDVQSERDPNVVATYFGGNPHTGASTSSFDIDEITLVPKVTLNDNLYLYARLQHSEATASVIEYCACFSLPHDLYLKIGRFRRMTYPGKIPESHGLYGAFLRNRTLGMQLGGEHKTGDAAKFYWGLSLTNGFALGNGPAGGDLNTRFPAMTDGNDIADTTNFKETGLLAGIKYDFAEAGKLDFNLAYFKDRLSRNELDNIVNPILFANGLYRNMPDPGTALGRYLINDDRDSSRLMMKLRYDIKGFTGQFRYVMAEDSKIERDGFELALMYKFKLAGMEYGGDKWFTSITPYISYAELNMDKYNGQTGVGSLALDSYTWNRDTITLSLLVGVCTNTTLKFEYYICDEELKNKKVAAWAGVPQFPSSVDNDEFCVNLCISF